MTKPKRDLGLREPLRPKEKLASETTLINAAFRQLGNASTYLWRAQFWLEKGEEGQTHSYARLSRKNLERARASYHCARSIAGATWPVFESRYEERVRDLEVHEIAEQELKLTRKKEENAE